MPSLSADDLKPEVYVVVALGLWFFTFRANLLDFWVAMSTSTTVLLLLAYFHHSGIRLGKWRKANLLFGVLSGIGLYLLLFGAFLAASSLFGFVVEDASSVYQLRHTLPEWLIATLLVFPISPSEEVFWRGLVQREWRKDLGGKRAWLVQAAAYSGVHVVTLNASLLLVAFLAGLLWGWTFERTGSLLPGILSHVTFNLFVFVLFPFV